MEKQVTKLLMKIGFILLIVMLILPNYSSAGLWDDIKAGAQGFIGTGSQGAGSTIDPNDPEITNAFMGVAEILTTIGTVICVIGAMVMGIKYMGASPEEAAKLKTQAIGLVVAAVVIFGAYGIWRVAYLVMKDILK